MNWVVPGAGELHGLRPDPLLWEQELDVRPAVAEAIEGALGFRAGERFWRSEHDHLYSLKLLDSGTGRPSMARVYGYWDRYEPRPPEHEIDRDLFTFLLWFAKTAGLDPAHVRKVAQHAGIEHGWPAGSVLRTPEERFANLSDYPYLPKYVEIEGLRMAWVEQGDGDPILLLHGAPAWGYVYRHMIPPLTGAGRAIVPDLIGSGRSDKPTAANAYSHRSHARWLRKFIEALDLQRITLVCQGSAGVPGLRALARMPERFSRLVAMNTGFPDGSLPGHHPDDPGAWENRAAIKRLRELDLPVLLIQGGKDETTAPDEAQLRGIFRNVAPESSIADAGHFIQEDAGEEVARPISAWLQSRALR